ncbi:DNA polymerase III subunit chi [Sphingobium phenoxybenzoativorans]|uniref:DNA polymerase III subunit chi n=1 Tax=Sphingobium phenoxybenzoativorans TaxID=1592790 RepID=UPI00087332BE|nr:DNA polymerase III subunit chi [Sphingobium phenoxybenzoativorans]
MQADFYQLSRDPVDKVLPAIAQRIIAGGGRLLVVAAEPERLDEIGQSLWSHQPASFLAHGHAQGENPSIQPILLSGKVEPSNGARYIALADGLWRDEALTFDRAFYFFDAMTIEAARANWRIVSKLEGVEARFHRQEGGRWIRAA